MPYQGWMPGQERLQSSWMGRTLTTRQCREQRLAALLLSTSDVPAFKLERGKAELSKLELKFKTMNHYGSIEMQEVHGSANMGLKTPAISFLNTWT